MPTKRLSTKSVQQQPNLSDALSDLRHLEPLTDNLGELASALHGLVHMHGFAILAKYGSAQDQAKVVEMIKRNYFYDDFPHEELACPFSN